MIPIVGVTTEGRVLAGFRRCAECRWFVPGGWFNGPRCDNLRNFYSETNPITGQVEYMDRGFKPHWRTSNIQGLCGMKGEFWEAAR